MPKAHVIEQFDYVLKGERDLPKDEQTIWHLKVLSFAERKSLMSSMLIYDVDSEKGKVSLPHNDWSMAEKVLNFGLIGWDNFCYPEGGNVAFRVVEENGRRIIPQEMLDAIQPWAIELANAITERASVSKSLEKNSKSR